MGLKPLFICHLFPGCCTSLPFSSLMTWEVVGTEAGRLLRVQSTRDSGTPWIRGCLHNLDIPGQLPSILPREAILLGSSYLLAKTSYPFSILLATSMLLPRAASPPPRSPTAASLEGYGSLFRVLLSASSPVLLPQSPCEYLSDTLGQEFLTSSPTELFLSSPWLPPGSLSMSA